MSHSKPFNDFISLGTDCSCRYQTARATIAPYLGENAPVIETIDRDEGRFFPLGAMFFDWLITPLPALILCLEGKFRGVMSRENLELMESGISVRDRFYGLEFPHSFHTPLTGESLGEQYPDAYSKSVYMMGKFINLPPGRYCFVRSGHVSALDADRIVSALQGLFPDSEIYLLVVPVGEEEGVLWENEQSTSYGISRGVNKPHIAQWQGDDEKWSFLERIPLVER